MALPPIVTATIQSSVIGASSNILAQAITSYKTSTPFIIDWVPVFQFFLYSVVNTPPNFLWQEFLEQTFPAYHVAPTKEAIASAAAGDDKALDNEAKEGRLVEPKLNIRNTLIKTLLDQTVGAAVNTLLFSMFMRSIKLAMAHHGPSNDLAFLLGGGGGGGSAAVDYGKVNWAHVWDKSRGEFWSIIRSGWTLWPFVSLVNFAFVKTVETRNLVGSLAGVVWGIYMSLFASGQ